MRDISYRVAVGGIVSALCLISMFVAGIFPVFYIIMPMVSGVLLMIIAQEINPKCAVLTYISVSILSLFITADKECSLIFIMIFGHYPIMRCKIGNIKNPLRFIIKFAVFNISVLAFVCVSVFIFGMTEIVSDMGEFGKYAEVVGMGLANVIFILYDYNLTIINIIYREKFMPKFRRKR